jgi:hypothetical protein
MRKCGRKCQGVAARTRSSSDYLQVTFLTRESGKLSNTQSLQCACCVYTIYVTHGPHTVPLYKVPLQYHDIRYIGIRHPHEAKNRSKRDSINVVVHVDGVKTTSLNCGHQRGDCPPLRCWTCTATVEWYWQGKTENRRTQRRTCPSATLSTTNPTSTHQGANPGLRVDRQATNRLSHGTDWQGHYIHLLYEFITIAFCK